ncbi:MAG: prolipoprotein diacylglyceryl transferase [Rickettsia endosymbiont of Culicoides impunctatus]|uniref:prolipoprotein diacylglyceryl transferase n=1 Tax=unclassified Candidatus Tisiphia TaxID=2996318 RepID=UPI001E73772B|nr:MAG: prolipoprotein diacylglyceryl transferase [Rickettsia endosymbiont of Culicoides impunctatus]
MLFPNINPVIFSIGSFTVYWYSMAYVLGIIAGWFYAYKIIKKFEVGVTTVHLENFVTWAILGIVIGGRLGYVFLYNPIQYFSDPILILKTYEGGMSFHGGVIGLIISSYFFCYKHKVNSLLMCDILATVGSIGLFLGRIANFINGELYGRVTTMPWGMIFPNSDLQLRHPSQLYEAFFEGIVLFIILAYATFKYKTINIHGLNFAIFLIFYSVFRIIIEMFREPDFHIGFIFNNLTMGQILSLPMLILGIYLIIRIKCQSTPK